MKGPRVVLIYIIKKHNLWHKFSSCLLISETVLLIKYIEHGSTGTLDLKCAKSKFYSWFLGASELISLSFWDWYIGQSVWVGSISNT